MYGSNIAKTGPAATCVTNTQVLGPNINATVQNFIHNLTIFGYLHSVDLGLGVFYKASSLISDCFQGVFDAKDNLLLYSYFVIDWNILKYNLIYNFGLIYEAFKSVVYFFYYPKRNTVATPEDLGR